MHACVRYAPLVALLAMATAGARVEEGVPAGKLPRDVVPLHYRLELRIDPAAAGFSGEVRIRVRIAAPTATIWLHARELEIERASVTKAGAEAVALTARVVHESGVLKLGAAEALPAGEAELALSFRAPFGSQLDGTYKVSVAERAYVMTQMEPLAARKSFPCFDEPAFKTAWDVTLVVPFASVAVANTRQRSETKLADGWRKVVFETSTPLPTYLIAYAVGPWDVVAWAPIPPTPQRRAPIPLRGIAALGHGPELRYALAETARAVSALEAWFDLAYPFDKLDLLAAPDFAAGAMENAGLVIYQERLLLVDQDSPTNLRRAFVVTHLHELAHQWFGNSVTMPWWDDLWLNEALATWLSLKLTAALEPGFEVELHQLEAVRWAMQSDSLASARRIAEPIRDFRDVASAFDGITYVKGAAVLAMFEAYLGAERFQGALRAYVRAHAGGSATSADLVRALAAASDDPAGFSAAFRSFLDQPGVPFALAGLECREGKPLLAVTQQRFLPLGASVSAAARWGLPVCVAHGREASRTTRCALVAEPAAELALPAGSCADWLLPNAGAAGYYRFSLAPADRARLAAAFPGLAPREQWVVVDAMDAAFEAGELTPAEFLAAVQEPAASHSWAVARAPLARLDWLRDQLAGPEQRPNLAAFVRRNYGPRLAALGSEDRAEDGDAARIERQALIQLLSRADDCPLRRELAARGRAVLLGAHPAPERLDPDQRATALWVLAQDGNEADFSALESAFAAETDAQLRLDLVRALASALEPQRAARVRALALAPEVRTGELAALLEAQLDWEPNRAAGRAWFRENVDAVLAKLPAQQAAYAPALYASGACSEAEADEVETLFAARVAPLEGGPRAMAQLAEAIRLCAALRAHHAKSGFGSGFGDGLQSFTSSLPGAD